MNETAKILAKLEEVERKIAKAEGAFWATGKLGGIILFIGLVITGYMFNKIEIIGVETTQNSARIAIIETRMERVSFKP